MNKRGIIGFGFLPQNKNQLLVFVISIILIIIIIGFFGKGLIDNILYYFWNAFWIIFTIFAILLLLIVIGFYIYNTFKNSYN